MIATNNRRINAFAERLVTILGGLPTEPMKDGLAGLALAQVIWTIRGEARRPEYQEPHIGTFLDLSTAHLTPVAMKWLKDCSEANRLAEIAGSESYGGPISTCGATMCGWFTAVPASPSNGGLLELPFALQEIFTKARSLDVHYILFDRDADEMPDLPTYDEHGLKIAEEPDNAELAGDYGLGEEFADMSVLSEPEARAASTESHRPPWDVAATRVTGARVFLSALRDDPIAELAEIVSPNISEAKRSMSHGAQLMEFAGKNLAVGVKDVLSSAADLIEEAMSVHIYDADQGEEPEPDCPYTAMVKRLRYFAGQL